LDHSWNCSGFTNDASARILLIDFRAMTLIVQYSTRLYKWNWGKLLVIDFHPRQTEFQSVTPVAQLDALLARDEPLLALAPMQDVTDLPFWTLLAKYGGPDVYYTEYFRVYPDSRLQRHILASITENPTGKPVIAQMIGNDVPALVRTAEELQRHEIAGVDLNLGCPAPVVYRKCAGGGLLR
jgi:hypothetical protein